MTTDINFSEEPQHAHDIVLQELVETHHMHLLAKADVVSKVLNDLRDDEKTTTDGGAIGGKFNIDSLR